MRTWTSFRPLPPLLPRTADTANVGSSPTTGRDNDSDQNLHRMRTFPGQDDIWIDSKDVEIAMITTMTMTALEGVADFAAVWSGAIVEAVCPAHTGIEL
jgi:hypothetical protein